METMGLQLATHQIALVNGLNNRNSKILLLDVSGPAYQYDFYEDDSDFFTQPGKLFRLMSPEQQQALFDNTAAAMNGVPDFIKERHAKHCYQCDPAYGEGIAKALGMDIDFSDVK